MAEGSLLQAERGALTDLPFGYCQCGCGLKTKLATRTDPRRKSVKGWPNRYLAGHQNVRYHAGHREEDRGYETPCWVWTGAINRLDGYGRDYRNRGKGTTLAHRLYYEKQVGPVPDGRVLDHLCGVKECVRPTHLEIVHQSTNVRRGALAKLNEQAVAEIARLHREGGWTHQALGKRFGVAQSTITEALTGANWSKPKEYRKPGSVNGRGRLDAYKATVIRKLHGEGVSPTELAKQFEVSRGQIYNVLTGRCWA